MSSLPPTPNPGELGSPSSTEGDELRRTASEEDPCPLGYAKRRYSRREMRPIRCSSKSTSRLRSESLRRFSSLYCARRLLAIAMFFLKMLSAIKLEAWNANTHSEISTSCSSKVRFLLVRGLIDALAFCMARESLSLPEGVPAGP